MRFGAELFETFLALLPHDTLRAAEQARGHDARLRGQGWYDVITCRAMRHAVEIRHESFRDSAFIKLLRCYKVALVCADTVEWPRLMDVTADFVYCRLHGSEVLYATGYDDEALRQWAVRVHAWAVATEPEDAKRVAGETMARKSGRDVLVYFDNDIKVRAPADARRLAKMLRAMYATN